MDARLTSIIESHISRGLVILDSYVSELQALDAPLLAVGRGLLAEGAGALVTAISRSKTARGYGKRLANGVLQAQKKQAQQQIIGHHYQLYMSWVADVRSVLEQVSTLGARANALGNSHVLVRKVSAAERLQKLDSRIRRVVSELEGFRAQGLTWNSELPKALPPSSASVPDLYTTLHRLEDMLRRCIERELSRVSANWWSERIPARARHNADSRKKKREAVWPWYPPMSESVVDYLDFSDYRTIILDPTNWNGCFDAVFKSQSFIEVRLSELEPVRNDVAHSRDVGATAAAKLRIYAAELKACIERN